MSTIFSIFSNNPFFILPDGWVGWLGFVGLIGGLGYIFYHWRGYSKSWSTDHWVLFIILLVLTPLLNLFIGFSVPVATAIPVPRLAHELSSLPLMVFSALLWLVAGGILGPYASAGLGFIAGCIIGYWGTHSSVLPLEIAFLGLVFSVASMQRYRTILFRGLRHPILAAIGISLFYPLLFFVSSVIIVPGTLTSKLDYAITHVGSHTFIIIAPIILGGIFVEVFKIAYPKWGGQEPWLPSPPERNIETRFSYILTPAVALLLLVFMIGDWVVAGRAASNLLRERMEAAAEVASDNVPYFLDTGQNQILLIASHLELGPSRTFELEQRLSQNYHLAPFFRQLFILDENLQQIADYPAADFKLLPTSVEEQLGLGMALNGVPVQVYAIPPFDDGDSAQISFIASIGAEDGSPDGVLVGRTDLTSNPYTQSILMNLNSVIELDGVGLLVDSDGKVLFQSDSEWKFDEYADLKKNQPDFFYDNAPDGSRLLVSSQPTEGRTWVAVIMVPARKAQQIAIDIAAPLLGMIILLSGVSALLLKFSLRVITSSLKSLTLESERIAQGRFEHALSPGGVDEAGRLRNSFEKMRRSLKARLDELNRLLLVSQGVASNLNIKDALQPIVESALTVGASFSRIILSSEIVPDIGVEGEFPSRFGAGKDADIYQFFDDQILALLKDEAQGQIILTNPVRTPLLSFGAGAPKLGSLMAVALYHEQLYYGVLWAGYDQPHTFSEEEVQFLTTLGGQASLATSNARLFMTAEFERQRLAAILASTPDPVLVTDQDDRLLLVNAEAWQALGLKFESGIGKPVDQVIVQPELVKLLRISDQAQDPIEVTLADGHTFMATASEIRVDGNIIGRVCVLKDITQFIELDALKSEFVSTVSHDLRSPLTLMRGYATMLEMVGELNDQQAEYVSKIVVGVESISRLVNNLLDLGRIEAGVGLQLEMLPVREIVEVVVDSFQLQAKQKRIDLRTEFSDGVPPIIEADQALLQQALHNLVENAVKYTPDGGKVWVRLKSRPNSTLFLIEDTGIGISPVDKPRLFEKFYRSSNRMAKKERGSGLGLAIVKSIVERHGGQMGVESRLGEGSIFYMDIPLRYKD